MMFWSFGSNGAAHGASNAPATTITQNTMPIAVAG